MRQTAPAWAKTLLTVLLLVHLLIHPTLHAIAPVADGPTEVAPAAGTTGSEALGEGRAPCLACRIGSNILPTAVAVEPLTPGQLSESLLVVDRFFVPRLSPSSATPRAPPLT